MLMTPTLLLGLLIGLSVALAITVCIRPGVACTAGGKILVFCVLFLLPVLTLAMVTENRIEHTKQTEFCLSCHTMEPYGKSLLVDDKSYIPAAHFQNARIPRDQACYTCHTDYTLYGGVHAKLRGMVHVYKQYISHPSNPVHLYTPFNNRECLHCHEGARSFEEQVVHTADPQLMADIKSNKMSCTSSGCHDTIHNVTHLGTAKYWKEQP